MYGVVVQHFHFEIYLRAVLMQSYVTLRNSAALRGKQQNTFEHRKCKLFCFV